MGSGAVDFGQGPVGGTLDVEWIHGAPSGRHSLDPPLQVHRYDEHTYVLRQSKALHFEAPFLFLLFGNDRALLVDTGATADPGDFPLRHVVDRLISRWLSGHPRDDYGLVVGHTHAHGDHVAADGQFADRASTTLVGTGLDAVRAFYGFGSWPDATVILDLGGRRLEVTGTPGHHEAAVAFYDPWTGFLLTGDNVYRGRLYVCDMPAFVDSLDRLVAVTERRPVSAVLGCHIEMTSEPGRDYPIGTTYQPDEPPLQLGVDRLAVVRAAAHAVRDRPGAHTFDDFIIFNGPCRLEVTRQLVRTAWGRLRTALAARRRPAALLRLG
jgi:hydroxyacylglutathione hydrolase